MLESSFVPHCMQCKDGCQGSCGGSCSALLSGVAQLHAQAKRASARSVNAVMTVTYWEIGRRIVEHEHRGKARAAYGEALIDRLARDLAARFGKGFSQTNLQQMREFFLAWPIRQTLSDESTQTVDLIVSVSTVPAGETRTDALGFKGIESTSQQRCKGNESKRLHGRPVGTRTPDLYRVNVNRVFLTYSREHVTLLICFDLVLETGTRQSRK